LTANSEAPSRLRYNAAVQLIDGIRRHGFRKWYERELMQSHAHLALTLVCAVGLFAAFDGATTFTGWGDRVIDTLTILACGSIGYWAACRYLHLLMHAESVANQADCPQCGVYARFKLVEGAAAAPGVRVRCRDCAHQWSIED
jgi:predicted Zn finger-like uncharacterized protein